MKKEEFEVWNGYEEMSKDSWLNKDWILVKMLDESGWTFVNTKTGKLLKERFDNVETTDLYNDDSFVRVEMKDGSGCSIFDKHSERVLDCRFKEISALRENSGKFVVKLDEDYWSLYEPDTGIISCRFDDVLSRSLDLSKLAVKMREGDHYYWTFFDDVSEKEDARMFEKIEIIHFYKNIVGNTFEDISCDVAKVKIGYANKESDYMLYQISNGKFVSDEHFRSIGSEGFYTKNGETFFKVAEKDGQPWEKLYNLNEKKVIEGEFGLIDGRTYKDDYIKGMSKDGQDIFYDLNTLKFVDREKATFGENDLLNDTLTPVVEKNSKDSKVFKSKNSKELKKALNEERKK